MITKESLIEEIEFGRYDVQYFRPPEHIEFMCEDENGYGKGAFVIKEDDATDFGCMAVYVDKFSWAPIRFDWYSGRWLADDMEMKVLIEDGSVRSELNAHFADKLDGLSPAGGFGNVDSIKGWQKIIARCLDEDESRIRVIRDSGRQGEEYDFKYSPPDSNWDDCKCYFKGE